MDETSTAELSIQRKRSAFRPRSAQDWDPYYETIKRLYVTENLQLEAVKTIMEEVYDFKATYEYAMERSIDFVRNYLRTLADDAQR